MALLVLNVVVYAALPLSWAALRTPLRLVLLYVHIAVALTVGGFLGAVYAVPLADGIRLSAGSMAYGGVMFTAVVAAMVGRDLRIIRNVAVVVLAVNAVKVAQFLLIADGLASARVDNPLGVPGDLFALSVRSVVVGGTLIVAELLALLLIFEQVKRRTGDVASRVLYVIAFVGVLTLDGLLFPLLAIPAGPELGPIIQGGVRAKLVLGLAYAVPLTVFLLAHRRVVEQYAATPLSLHGLLLVPPDRLIAQLGDQQAELEQHRRHLDRAAARSRRLTTITGALAGAPEEADIGELLGQLERLMPRIPGVTVAVPTLWTFLDGDVVEGVGGHGVGGPTPDPVALRRRAASTAAWHDGRGGRPVGRLRIGTAETPDGVLEVGIDPRVADAVVAELADLAAPLSTVMRPRLRQLRTRWAERQPLIQVLRERRLDVHFQPIVALTTMERVCYEALARFEPGISAEDRFREAARLGLQLELETLAIRRALEAAAQLPAGAAVSLNISPRAMTDLDLRPLLAGVQRPVVLEVTEHESIGDYEALARAMADLPDVSLAVDDAGSGYATLQHVLNLAPEMVKLDRSWVHDIDADRTRQLLVTSLLTFCTEIGATVVAEGVEREEEAAVLRTLGLRYAQGYRFARPAPAGTFTLDRVGELPFVS